MSRFRETGDSAAMLAGSVTGNGSQTGGRRPLAVDRPLRLTTLPAAIFQHSRKTVLIGTDRANQMALQERFVVLNATLLCIASLGAFFLLAINLVGVVCCRGYFKKKTRSLAYLNHPQSLSHSRQCRYASLLKRFSVDPVIGTLRDEWREDIGTDSLPPRRYERSWLPRFEVVHELPSTQFEATTENLQETCMFDTTATAVSETIVPARPSLPCGVDAAYGVTAQEVIRTCSADVEAPLCVCVDMDSHRRESWENETSGGPS